MVGPKVKVILEKYTQVEDVYATYTETWESVRYITGVLSLSSGRERVVHNKVEVYSSHVFFCDWQIGISIDEKYRLRYDQRIFEVLFIENPLAQNRFMKFYLDENV